MNGQLCLRTQVTCNQELKYFNGYGYDGLRTFDFINKTKKADLCNFSSCTRADFSWRQPISSVEIKKAALIILEISKLKVE